MKKEEKQSKLIEIGNLKKDIMMMRIKSSSGDTVAVKDYRIKKKEIARLFTAMNAKETAKVVKTAKVAKTKKTNKA